MQGSHSLESCSSRGGAAACSGRRLLRCPSSSVAAAAAAAAAARWRSTPRCLPPVAAAASAAPVASATANSSCYTSHKQRRGSTIAAAGHAPPSLGAAPEAPPPAKLAVFVSGGGSNFKAIHAACLDGRINGEIVAVVSDVPTCGGVTYAQSHGIHTLTFPVPKKGGFPGLSTEELIEELTQRLGAEYVLLAGFLKLIPADLVRCYKRKMLNIHPGLLPSFGGKGYYGEKVHAAVISSGARFSGPTVHFVDAEYDTGPILAQRVVPVLPTDTPKKLAARVLQQEHQVYPEAVAALVDGRITFREDGIPIMWSAH